MPFFKRPGSSPFFSFLFYFIIFFTNITGPGTGAIWHLFWENLSRVPGKPVKKKPLWVCHNPLRVVRHTPADWILLVFQSGWGVNMTPLSGFVYDCSGGRSASSSEQSGFSSLFWSATASAWSAAAAGVVLCVLALLSLSSAGELAACHAGGSKASWLRVLGSRPDKEI